MKRRRRSAPNSTPTSTGQSVSMQPERCPFSLAHQFRPVDSAQTRTLIKDAQQRLFDATHPDPVIQAYMPGGSLFMRNPAPPLEALFPDGIPEGVSRRRLNIDMSNVPDDQEYGEPVLVDPANKKYFIGK